MLFYIGKGPRNTSYFCRRGDAHARRLLRSAPTLPGFSMLYHHPPLHNWRLPVHTFVVGHSNAPAPSRRRSCWNNASLAAQLCGGILCGRPQLACSLNLTCTRSNPCVNLSHTDGTGGCRAALVGRRLRAVYTAQLLTCSQMACIDSHNTPTATPLPAPAHCFACA